MVYKSKHLFHNYSTGKNYTRVWASNKVRKANDSGLLGEIVNVAGMHSLRRTCCYWDIREQTRFKTSTSLLGQKTY
jgi:hypothetical protein